MSHTESAGNVSQSRPGPSGGGGWEAYRSELVFLYVHERFTLDQVIEYMLDKYGFDASPRQYQEKFKQWRARKNITRAVRQEMSTKQSQGTLVLDADQRRRLDRQIKTHPERMIGSSSTPNSDQLHLASTPGSSNVSHSGASLQGVGSMTDEILPADQWTSPGPLLPVLERDDRLGFRPWRYDIIGATTSYQPSPPQSSSIMAAGGAVSDHFTISPSPPRMMTLNDNAEVIFFNVKQFCAHYVSEAPATFENDNSKAMMSSAVVKKSTRDLKDVIYLYKIQDFARADVFMDAYCSQPYSFVIDESVDFLRQLITTLAPINTTRKPAVRRRVLEHLHRLAKANLGAWHPFTVICKNLSLDQDSMETSIRALLVLQNSVLIWSRYMSFQTELDIVTMMRRAKEYDSALYKARLLVDTCSIVFGPDSYPVRKTKWELSCIYIAQEEFQSAIEVCLEVSSNHDDELALRAVENLAEIHRLKGEDQSSLTLLEAVADRFVDKHGHSAAATHVLDKMFEMLEKIGGPDQQTTAETYRKRYKGYV